MPAYTVEGNQSYTGQSGLPDDFYVNGPAYDRNFQYGTATITGFDPNQDRIIISDFFNPYEEPDNQDHVVVYLGDIVGVDIGDADTRPGHALKIHLDAAPLGDALNLPSAADLIIHGSDQAETYLTTPVDGHKLTAFYGGGGDDVVSADIFRSFAPSNAIVDGGDGFDTITYATATFGVNVTTVGHHFVSIEGLVGTAFNDTLGGSNADERLDGGAGDDTLSGGGGNDTLIGGAGNDTATYASASAGVTVDLSSTAAQDTGGAGTDTLSGIENLIGSGYGDHLTASAAAATIDGGGGNDTITGGGAIDHLSGSEGNDTVSGMDGNDVLMGGNGDDTLDGGNGDDLVIGSAGNDVMYGSFGIDTVSYADATAGVTVQMAVATQQNTGGSGLDTLNSFENLIGSSYNDAISGTLKANHLDGGAGNDTLYGEDNNDVLVGGAGNDVMDGGNGTDTASFAGETGGGVHLVLDAQGNGVTSGADGIDRLFSIESLIGSDAADVLAGNGGANSIDGGAGNDSLRGAGGDDTLLGGLGDDLLMGGAGNDMLDGGAGTNRASYSDAGAGVTVDLSHAGAQATGGSGTDTLVNIQQLFGSNYADTLTGDAGNNVLDGGAGADHLNGGLGNDTYYVDNTGDQITDTGGTDIVYSTVDVNIGYWTSIENVTLLRDAIVAKGNALDNHIVGDDQDNTLMGKAGDDTLTGGKGADAFRFDTALGSHNIDTITDFTPGTDHIELARSVFGAAGGPGELSSSAFQVGTVAENANTHILYNSATGELFYDPDGNGAAAAMEFAKVTPGTALTFADIHIV